MISSVSFTGYRPNKYSFIPENKKVICEKLICEITACIKFGYVTYYFGAAPGFDLLAAHVVIYLKRIFDIELICVLPYENFQHSNEFDEEWRK